MWVKVKGKGKGLMGGEERARGRWEGREVGRNEVRSTEMKD